MRDWILWISENPEIVGAIAIGCVVLFVLMLFMLISSDSREVKTLKFLEQEQGVNRNLIKGIQSSGKSINNFISTILGKFEEGQTWRDKVEQYVKNRKIEMTQVQKMSEIQLDRMNKIGNDYDILKGDHERICGELEEARVDIENKRSICTNQLKLINQRDNELNTQIMNNANISTEISELNSRLQDRNDELVNMRSEVLKARDKHESEYNMRVMAEKSHDRTKSKLDKLRKAVRGEGYSYELGGKTGRKINIFEVE